MNHFKFNTQVYYYVCILVIENRVNVLHSFYFLKLLNLKKRLITFEKYIGLFYVFFLELKRMATAQF